LIQIEFQTAGIIFKFISDHRKLRGSTQLKFI